MRFLLDTHVLLWWLLDDPRLGSKPRALIADDNSEVFFSIVSCWEASVKFRVGKMDVRGSALRQFALSQGLQPLGLNGEHIVELDGLARISGHRDPFDQLLVAQAKAEGLALMTHDRALPEYGVRCIGAR